MQFTLPYWYDLHAHFRQGDHVAAYINDHIAMKCAGVLAMPNTNPPVAKVSENDSLPYTSIEQYKKALNDAGAHVLKSVIVPLYLTKDTTPEMITNGAKSGSLKACKYYPPHGTTGAGFGVPLDVLINNGVIKSMEENSIILCIHGEEHGLSGPDYFDAMHNAETAFYTKRLPELIKTFPNLKIVCEHVTTKTAVDFVLAAPSNVAATITPQHLLYTMGHLVQGLKYHLYCLPLLKFEDDRQALRDAVIDPNNTKFFAGTDSAPHTEKVSDCGCAAGCYTGGIAPQLYIQAFEEAGLDMMKIDNQSIFKAFLCENGPQFYNLPIADETFTLSKAPQTISALQTGDHTVLPLPLGLGQSEIPWSIID